MSVRIDLNKIYFSIKPSNLCPVTIKKTGVINESCKGKRPVIFGDHIYFLRDHKAKKEFLARPLDYLFDQTPEPSVFPSICITGPPKSGKTSLAKRAALDLELMYLTVPSIINSIVDSNDVTSAHENVKLFKSFRI